MRHVPNESSSLFGRRAAGVIVAAVVALAVGTRPVAALGGPRAWQGGRHMAAVVVDGRDLAPSDSADVAAVVKRFHDALAAGDSSAALALLADDVVVLETGGVETRDDYRAHHLPADIEFARAVPSQRGPVQVRVKGDVAWASGTSVTLGEFRGRQINSAGAELVVLSREGGTWKIRAIHWSSRTRRQPAG